MDVFCIFYPPAKVNSASPMKTLSLLLLMFIDSCFIQYVQLSVSLYLQQWKTVFQDWLEALHVPVGLIKDRTGQESCIQGCSFSLSWVPHYIASVGKFGIIFIFKTYTLLSIYFPESPKVIQNSLVGSDTDIKVLSFVISLKILNFLDMII